MTSSRHNNNARAFTLIELLVVISIIALLIGILLPVLGAAKFQAKVTMCSNQLHQMGIAIHAFATDSNGYLPQGPVSTASLATNQVYSLAEGHVGLGFLELGDYVESPEIFYCADDNETDIATEMNNFETQTDDAYCSYLYRHGDEVFHTDPTGGTPNNIATPGTDLFSSFTNAVNQRYRFPIDRPVYNSSGMQATAVAADMNSLSENVGPIRTNHSNRVVSALFLDGHVNTFNNSGTEGFSDGPYSLQSDVAAGYAAILAAIDQLIINLDATQSPSQTSSETP